MPTELTDEQRAAVESLATVTDEAPRGRWRVRWMTDVADNDANRAVYVISVAAELTGVHPQTLRIYERKGLLDPVAHERREPPLLRSDLSRLRHIQELTATGLNLEGVRRVLELEAELERLRAELEETPGAVPRRRWPPPIASTAGTWSRCAKLTRRR